jgi:hypothetical protein
MHVILMLYILICIIQSHSMYRTVEKILTVMAARRAQCMKYKKIKINSCR